MISQSTIDNEKKKNSYLKNEDAGGKNLTFFLLKRVTNCVDYIHTYKAIRQECMLNLRPQMLGLLKWLRQFFI